MFGISNSIWSVVRLVYVEFLHKPHYWSNTITYTKHDSSQPISVLLRNSTYTSATTDQILLLIPNMTALSQSLYFLGPIWLSFWGRFDLGPIWLEVDLNWGRFDWKSLISSALLIKYYYLYQTWQLSANLCSSKKFYIHKCLYWSNTITYTKHDSSQPISVVALVYVEFLRRTEIGWELSCLVYVIVFDQ
jgi:hypothetical protein